jgi:GMP synthase (glutamine-hydrolysing)
MIYLVDNTIDGRGVSPLEIKDALERLRPGETVLVEPFQRVSLGRVRELSPSHVILSGQSHPWTEYAAEELAGVYEVIREGDRPILGICGGHQQIALCYGAEVGLMKRIGPGEGYEGALRERGFHGVETTGGTLFEGLPREVNVWHSHCDEVKELPAEFELTASNRTCRIQAMRHRRRLLFGVQFHPELFDKEHPEGSRILENFLGL